jgi:hypothetical protein
VLLCPKYDTPENQQLVKDSTDAINSGEITLSSTTTGVS